MIRFKVSGDSLWVTILLRPDCRAITSPDDVYAAIATILGHTSTELRDETLRDIFDKALKDSMYSPEAVARWCIQEEAE